MRKLIKVEKSNHFDNLISYKVLGTPVDCVKFGMANVIKEKPDLLVAGINHGSNASINLLYSGTVAAAMEGAIHGISSIAFSLTKYDKSDIDLSISKKVADHIARNIIENPLPYGIMLNVNIPYVPEDELKGIRVCRQAKSVWHEEFLEDSDPEGEKGYWMTGEFECLDSGNDFDDILLHNNYVTVVPINIDLTAHDSIFSLKKLEK